MPDDSSEFHIPRRKKLFGHNSGFVKTAAESSGLQSKFNKNSDYGVSKEAKNHK